MKTMTVDQLALADLNFAEMCRGITRNAGGRVLEVDGLLMWSGTHPSLALVSGLILTRCVPAPAGENFDLPYGCFGESGLGYTVLVTVGTEDHLEQTA